MSQKLILKRDIMYAAGFFDAEGSIWINKQKRKSCLHLSYNLRINVTSTNRSIIHWFKTNFGGSNRINLRGKNPLFRWDAHGNIATNFLQKIIPYLRIKRSRAKLAFQFQAEINENRIRKGVKYNLVSPKSLYRREEFKNQMIILNHSYLNMEIEPLSRYGISYAAGLFDGDGSISIFVYHGAKHPHHYLNICLGTTFQPIAYWLKDCFGGSVWCQQRKLPEHPLYYWRAYAGVAENFLQRILLRLRLKKLHAKLALQFRKEKKRNKRRSDRPQWITSAMLSRREQFRQQMCALNRGF